jgi:dimethylglycine dehydrogenase
VGLVTSAAYGHRVGRSLGFAVVEPPAAGPGTVLEVDVVGRRRAATVLEDRAVYDPEARRVRA